RGCQWRPVDPTESGARPDSGRPSNGGTAQMLGRSISPETAATLTGIMEQVVDRGTATSAKIDGYTIAGKTGTSHKLINGRYAPSDYNASFVGFIPSRNARVAIIVVLDSPHGPAYTGGPVSGPIFQK